MQQKIVGTTLSVLGIAGLVLSLFYVSGADSNSHLTVFMVAGTAGAVAFFAGLWLFGRLGNNVQDKARGWSVMGIKESKAVWQRVKERGRTVMVRVKKAPGGMVPLNESQLQ